MVVSAAGSEWWIETGPVKLELSAITIQRGSLLVAGFAQRADGTLRLAAYRPLDARSARLITNLSLRPYPEGGTVCMRESNWE